MRGEARAGLYVHVPFCARRCAYCDFATGAVSAGALARYLEGIERECALRAAEARGTTFTSLFFGGGTPSMLSARDFTRVARALRAHFDLAPDAEITLEANPESVRGALLEAWRAAGVNRLSMGAQSFDAGELERLGRIHGPERPAEAVAEARAHGFARVSLDLMFAFPGHTLERWEETLARALALDLEHLSAYAFIPEEGTPLGDAVRGRHAAVPDEHAQADAYALLSERLESAGYRCYETSNFARPGGEARHNLVYWLVRPYAALGPSAHGRMAGRYANHRDLASWAAALEAREAPETRERWTRAARAQEVVLLGLRLGCGIQPDDHDAETWFDVAARYGAALEGAVSAGRLERAGAGYRVPARFRFVADDAIAWIEARARPLPVDSVESHFIPSMPCPSPPSPVASAPTIPS